MHHALGCHDARMQAWRVTHIQASCRPYGVETLPKGRHDAPMELAGAAMVHHDEKCQL